MKVFDEKKYFEEVKNIEDKFYDITSNFNFNFPKPLNLQEEKAKFFQAIEENRVYNPQIKYNAKFFIPAKIDELHNFKIDTTNDYYGFKTLYKNRIKTKISEIRCHNLWGSIDSTKYVKEYRGEPDKILLFKAKRYCKNYVRKKILFKRITVQQLAEELKSYIFNLTGNKDIRINYVDINSKVNISPVNAEININPNESFKNIDLERLKVHEIGTHYMRYFNGARFNIKILESGTSNYIQTEEGIAAYIEELKGVSSTAQMFIYAGRVIATYYALRKSFYDVYQILKKFNFKDTDAFAITYRAKRNLCDTSQIGGFTKDYVYFKGYHKIKKFAKNNDIKDLFIGKIKIDDLKLIKNFLNKHRKDIVTILD